MKRLWIIRNSEDVSIRCPTSFLILSCINLRLSELPTINSKHKNPSEGWNNFDHSESGHLDNPKPQMTTNRECYTCTYIFRNSYTRTNVIDGKSQLFLSVARGSYSYIEAFQIKNPSESLPWEWVSFIEGGTAAVHASAYVHTNARVHLFD